MQRPNIVVAGSMNMDIVVSMQRMPVVGETVQGEAIHYIPGGKGANQGVGAARLGASVAMIGAVGGDLFGRQIEEKLANLGIDTAGIVRLDDEPTGTATIFHTADDNCIVIVAGANGRCSEQLIAAHAETIRRADLLLTQLEVPLEAVRAAMSAAKEAGVRTVLNPAPAAELPDDVLRLADYVTPNETEFALMSGSSCSSEEEWEQAMRAWEQRYGHRLVVTRGSRGCSYLADGTIRTVPALPVEPVDTTGAGDAFNAALGYMLAAGSTLEAAVPFAVRAASLSVTRFGAQDGMPTLEEVERTWTEGHR